MKNYIFTFIFLCLLNSLNAQEQFSVFFDSNKHEPNKKENHRLQQWILENSNSKILAINGYTDEDGSTGFNDTLAKKRVGFIFTEIKDRVQIREDFKSRSFGEIFKQSINKAENR
jgi:outer membrane protein OmpA-like peptidoglycan-associated protein